MSTSSRPRSTAHRPRHRHGRAPSARGCGCRERSSRWRAAVRAGGVVLAAGSLLAMFVFSVTAPRVAILVLEGIPLGIVGSVLAFAIDRRAQEGADAFRS